jgi:hypothetical protein
MSASLGIGVKLIGKKPVVIEGLGAAKCDFASMDSHKVPGKLSSEAESGQQNDISTDMEAALKKLENRRAAAALNQNLPQSQLNKHEQDDRSNHVRFPRIQKMQILLLSSWRCI